MKPSAVLPILLLSPFFCLAQSFNNSFILKQPNKTTEGYSFYPNNEFSWFRASPNSKESGHGKYSISNNTITLNFLTAQRQFDIQVAELERNETGFCNIEVRALHSNGPPLPGLKIILEKSKLTQTTNSHGQASIEIRQPIDHDKIIFELDGLQTPWKTFPLKGINFLFALVVDDNIKYREHQTATFEFKKTRSHFQVSTQPKFKKVSRKKFIKLLSD